MEVLEQRPTVALNVTVDDLQVTAVGTADSVVGDLVRATEELHETIARDLRCVVKVAKAAVAASDPKVATRLRRALADRGGAEHRAIEVLGCDYTAGARRGGGGRLGVQAKRVVRAALRYRRATPLAQVNHRKAVGVTRQGGPPCCAVRDHRQRSR